MGADRVERGFSLDYQEKMNAVLSRWGISHEAILSSKAKLFLSSLKNLRAQTGELSALDVGCGPGGLTRELAPHFKSMAACDANSEAIPLARRAGISSALIENGKLPYGEAEFDVLFCSMVIHHVAERERSDLMREIARVLKPGGRAVFSEHNPWSLLARYGVWQCELDGPEVRLISKPTLERLLVGAGLRRVVGSYYLFFPGTNGFQLESRWLGRVPLGAQYFSIAEKAKE